MEQTFIIRSLPPFEKNTKKRLVKSPKIYVRDSGLLHRLLQVTKGFWRAIEPTNPDKTYIVSPVSASYPFINDVEVCELSDFLRKVEL